MDPRYFATAADFRAWLAEHHDKEPELSVGFHKVGSGELSMTWPESVDVALSYGWIDAVRHNIDETRYRIRFTRRRPGGRWSLRNIDRVQALREAGLMTPAGEAAFDYTPDDKRAYAYEAEHAELTEAETKAFEANKAAWDFFQGQPPGYRRQMLYRVVSAKRPETRAQRLANLIDLSAQGRNLVAEERQKYRKP
jgi:uncharacterized protein YdeI (YjbR/CyaY-like superfamily)